MTHNLTAQQVAARMCRITEIVMEHMNFEHPTDCFCREGGMWDSEFYTKNIEENYRNDGESIKFIEEAVAEKIEKRNNQREINNGITIIHSR